MTSTFVTTGDSQADSIHHSQGKGWVVAGIGVPWLWVGAGVAALALGIAGRKFKTVAPWLAWVSLVLGGVTIFLGVSPAQYMAGMTGPLWLTIAALGLLKEN